MFVLIGVPWNDADKINDKWRYLTFEDGGVTSDDVLFVDVRIVELGYNYIKDIILNNRGQQKEKTIYVDLRSTSRRCTCNFVFKKWHVLERKFFKLNNNNIKQ